MMYYLGLVQDFYNENLVFEIIMHILMWFDFLGNFSVNQTTVVHENVQIT